MKIIKHISKEQYICEVLKDDLSSDKILELEKHRELIENPNFESQEQNKIRLALIRSNGAFGNIFEKGDFDSIFLAEINEVEFLNLYWCPKGTELEDEIDIISEGDRKLTSILSNLGNPRLTEIQKVKDYLDNFFVDRGEIKPENNRLFLFEHQNKLCIQDGNHRAGGIIKRLYIGKEHSFLINVFVVRGMKLT